MNTELEKYSVFIQKIESLLKRWVKAWGPNTSYSMGHVGQIVVHKDCITFSAVPNCSGIGCHVLKFDLKYLDDDSTLEADARAWYEAAEKERLDKIKKLDELKNSPQVKEYLSHTIYYPFEFNYIGL